jgi:hypothetical protein
MADTQNRFRSAKTLVLAMLIAILGLTTAATTAGASQSAETAAASHGTPFHRTELYFGRDRPGGEVSEAEFAHFLDVEVTKRFPDGLTLVDALGQFQDNGQVIKEKSKLLILLYPLSDRQADRRVEDIRTAYKVQFQQTSVLRVDTLDQVSF